MSEQAPALDGLWMPAEWEEHARCWMAWPCRMELWGERYEAACRAYASVARAIAAYEPVTMLARPEHVAVARLQVGRAVQVAEATIDDSWTRDSGPCFLVNGRGGVAGVAWRFNAWGNRFHGCAGDQALGGELLRHLGMRAYDGPMVLEGGAIHVDGRGTLIAVESCILNPNRNPTLDRRQVEERLAMYFGVRRIVWLEHGLTGDETDGHVDNVARFVAPGVVLCVTTDDPAHPDRRGLAENKARLAAARDLAGRSLQVLELPLPVTVAAREGPPTLPSYLNYYIANGAVVMPRFGDPEDDRAARVVGSLHPGRAVVQVDALDICFGGGGIHCITQQQPAGRPLA